MKKVRVTHPVYGMIVTAMIGMGCLGPALAKGAATQPATTQPDAIRPGEGVGPIRLGMSEAELEQVMGKATSLEWGGMPANVRNYPSSSVRVLLSKTEPRVVATIMGGRGEGPLSTLRMGPFPWRTAEGLGIGSTLDEVRGAWGEPESDRQADPQIDWRTISFSKRGIHFGMREGRVVWIAIRRPV